MNLQKIMREFLAAGDLSPKAWQNKVQPENEAVAQVSEEIHGALLSTYQSAARNHSLVASALMESFFSPGRVLYMEASLVAAGIDSQRDDLLAFLRENPEPSAEEWQSFLLEQLGPQLRKSAVAYIKELKKNSKGTIDIPVDERVDAIINYAIRNTEDVRKRYSSAPDVDGVLTAAGSKWNVKAFINNLDRLYGSIEQSVRDLTIMSWAAGDLLPSDLAELKLPRVKYTKLRTDGKGNLSGKPGPTGFTGFKRLVSDPNSKRHGTANNQVRWIDEPFELGERDLGGGRVLPAVKFSYPREDMTEVAEWSNSVLDYEFLWQQSDGTVSWISAKNGRTTAVSGEHLRSIAKMKQRKR